MDDRVRQVGRRLAVAAAVGATVLAAAAVAGSVRPPARGGAAVRLVLVRSQPASTEAASVAIRRAACRRQAVSDRLPVRIIDRVIVLHTQRYRC